MKSPNSINSNKKDVYDYLLGKEGWLISSITIFLFFTQMEWFVNASNSVVFASFILCFVISYPTLILTWYIITLVSSFAIVTYYVIIDIFSNKETIIGFIILLIIVFLLSFPFSGENNSEHSEEKYEYRNPLDPGY